MKKIFFICPLVEKGPSEPNFETTASSAAAGWPQMSPGHLRWSQVTLHISLLGSVTMIKVLFQEFTTRCAKTCADPHMVRACGLRPYVRQ